LNASRIEDPRSLPFAASKIDYFLKTRIKNL